MSCPLRVELNSTIKFDKSAVEAEWNFLIKFGEAIKFDKLLRATRSWQESDSNIMPLPSQTAFIYYI